MEEKLICGACAMVFRSTALLEKHKALFCIGGEVRTPQVQRASSEVVLRDSVDPTQTRTPAAVQMRGQRRWRSADEPASGRAEGKRASAQTDGAALRNLTDEFRRLRTSIEENLWKGATDTEACGCHLGHCQRLKETREMATLHERQLALIRAHNQTLEQHRDELAHQVSVLSERSNTGHLESLLTELREQEERNEETLQQMAEHLHALQLLKVCVPADQPEPGRNTEMRHDNYEHISSADGPLPNQIAALRQTYLQSGGSDPDIVAQMMDLQAEAQSVERNRQAASVKAKEKKVKPCQRRPSWELLVLEQENQKLEEEILRIQLARERKHHCEAAVRTELELAHTAHLQQIASLQAELERITDASGPCPQPAPPPRPHPHPHPVHLQTKAHTHSPLSLMPILSSLSGRCRMDPLDSLGPAPYDPAAGFVLFFDLLLGVDASQKVLRLLAALYSDGQAAGLPTPLPPVQCLPHSLSPGNCALLSVKQPAPRIRPSPSLCLLVEVQAATDLDVSNQEVCSLTTCGWTQLELFDQHNQLCSGHWRVPVRSLPVKPPLSVSQLNSIPQVGNMELCVRLVNGRDGDVQTLMKPDPTSTGHYKYQAVASSHPLTVHGNAALPVSAPQPTGADQLSSLLTLPGHKDPPPTDEASQG